jgi:hypothetical protein
MKPWISLPICNSVAVLHIENGESTQRRKKRGGIVGPLLGRFVLFDTLLFPFRLVSSSLKPRRGPRILVDGESFPCQTNRNQYIPGNRIDHHAVCKKVSYLLTCKRVFLCLSN